MLKIARVLFPTDVSDRLLQAVTYVRGIADRFGAEVHVLHNLDATKAPHYDVMAAAADPGVEYAKAEAEIEECLVELARDLSSGNDHRKVVTLTMQRASPAESICTYAGENEIDLVLMITHATESLTHRLVGRIPQDVVEDCPCSVITLTARRAAQPPSFSRVLVPVNYAESSQEATSAAAQLIEPGGEVHLLHLVEVKTFPAYYGRHGNEATHYSFEELAEHTHRDLEAFWRERSNRDDVKVVVAALPEHSAKEILRYAEQHQCDLIVLATRGEGHLFRTMSENVALHPGPCPVLTLKHKQRPVVVS
jgi:nucleotide-binding universal stress UspA family protein